MIPWFFTFMDGVSSLFHAFVFGALLAAIAWSQGAPNWLVDAIGWSIFGALTVLIWNWLRSLHEDVKEGQQ